MSRGLIIIFFLQSFSCAFAQQEVKKYFDADGNETESSSSYYYSVGKRVMVNSSITGPQEVFIDTVKTYYTKSDKIRSKIVYDSKGSLNGIFEMYYENEKIKEQGTYLEGRRAGNYTSWYENEKIKEQGTYLEGRRTGTNTNWYENGKPSITLYYPSREERLTLPPIDFKIISYSDADGNQFVKDGNGYCKCYLSEFNDDLLENGKVEAGMRDSIWNGYKNGTLMFTEKYDNGKFINGVNYSLDRNYKYTQFEEPPKYIGGLEAMYKTISKNTIYPKDARKAHIQGAVYVSFVVRSDGSTSDQTVVKGIGKSCDDEALRVVKLLNKWNPGRQRGTPVNVKFVLPINFKL